MAKTTVKKAEKKATKKASKKAAKKRGSAKKTKPQPPRNRAEAEAFIKRHKLEELAPEAAQSLRDAFTE